ncbi:MAG: TauD/TfdA family dioxygenase [Pseudomonadota bacterium]
MNTSLAATSALPTHDDYQLHHLSPVIGTEVLGIDLRAVGDATIDWLSALLVERKVLFFRDQPLTIEAHLAFARRFGELEVHPFSPNVPDYPEVINLHNDRDNKPNINIWHSDVTWRAKPSLGSILRARVVPEVGGDTLFANMEAALEALDDDTRERIASMTAIHDNEGFLAAAAANGASAEKLEALRATFPPQRHPVVRTHPVSGRKSLYVNRAFTRCIEGLDDDESARLLRKLYAQAAIPDVQCRFRWRPDSIAFWDNRAVQHYAAADYWPAVRIMERVTIVGDRPR